MYYIADQKHFKIQEIEDVYIVFNRLSGKTHFLNFYSHEVLIALSKTSLKIEELHQITLERLGLSGEECAPEMAERAVSELEACGLVQISK